MRLPTDHCAGCGQVVELAGAARRSIFCILPPYLLREIAARGDKAQREFALRTLALDGTQRAQRVTYQLLGLGAAARGVGVPAPAAATAQRAIHTAGGAETLPGRLVRSEGQGPTDDVAVNEAYDGLGATFEFFSRAYGRNSIDDRGLPLEATVHYGSEYNNAFWNGEQMVFGDGDGVIFERFTIAVDVIGHELTHGVTGSEANLVYLRQSGALNESISDVFGSLVKQYALKQTADQADWLIGAGLLKFPGQALRSMKAPGTAYENAVMGKDPQPADMKHFVVTQQDNGGVHLNSGIPNRAFYLVATALGGNAWEKAGRIWYDAIRDKSLPQSADFAVFASYTKKCARSRYGFASAEEKAVVEAWKTVGVEIRIRQGS
jgi:Zn-dependent metalloprotease